MAARDAEFYNYLKQALRNKLRYPEAPSFRSGKYFFDYEYIFQQARRVLPQKYSIGHSYWKHGNERIPISYLNKQQLNELNLEFARDVVENWGGLDPKQTDTKYLDPVLAEYENELTAPEEPDSFHEENERNQKSDSDETDKAAPSETSTPPPSTPHPETPHLRPPSPSQRPPAFTRQTEEKLNKANQSMQQTQREISKRFPNAPQPSERLSQRLNSATRVVRGPETAIPRNRVQATRPVKVNRQNRRPRRVIPPIRPVAGGSGLGIPSVPKFLTNAARSLLRTAANLGTRAISTLARGAFNLGSRALAQLLPRLGMQAGLAAGRSLLLAGGSAIAGLGLGAILGILAIIGFFVFYFWSVFDANSECGKQGTPLLTKTVSNGAKDEQGNSIFQEGEPIEYKIQFTYQLKCAGSLNAEIRDNLPGNTTYVEGSAKSNLLANAEGLPTTSYEGGRDGNTLFWRIKALPYSFPAEFTFRVTPNETGVWITNQATAGYTLASGTSGGFSDITGLLPSPLTPATSNWADVKSQIIAAFNKHPELLDIYRQASSQSGIPWQVLAGLHFVETGSGPGPDSSLVSGRKIGQAEPDISPVKCASGVTGPGTPIPLGGGCGFSNQLDSAIYAANHLAEKIGKVPSTFPEIVEAMSKYNGGGNANCGEGLDYGPCPPQFFGEDDPYAMADFDDSHSNDKMYIIYCADFTRCNPPRKFGRPGAMGVVRALIEEGL